MGKDRSLSGVVAAVALKAAEEVRSKNARYAAMPLEDVVDAAEIFVRAIVRVVEGGSAQMLDAHLVRVAALRSDQGLDAGDIRDAFREARSALMSAMRCGATLPDGSTVSWGQVSAVVDDAERRSLNPNTHFIPHGVDVEHFSQAIDPATAIPNDLRELPRPVIGFFGLLADWVDLPLVREVALARPRWSIALLGKATTDLGPLRELPNVHLLGQKPHESGRARRSMLRGVVVQPATYEAIPRLVIAGGLDRAVELEASERFASWLGAEFEPFAAHSAYGLILGEQSHGQVADAIRGFLELHRL